MKPFLLLEYKIIIPVRIGNSDSYAALDTGSFSNYLSTGLADKFERKGTSRAKGLFNDVELSTVSVPTIEVLDHTYCDVLMSASESMQGEMKNGTLCLDAILGADLLLTQPIVLDFIRLQIGRDVKSVERFFSIPSEFRGGLPFVSASWGSTTVKALLDLGAGISVINNGRGNKLLEGLDPLYELEVDDILGGTRNENVYRVNQLNIGNSTSYYSDFIACDLTTFEETLDTDIDVVIGTNHLVNSHATWLIDRERELVSFSELPTGGDA